MESKQLLMARMRTQVSGHPWSLGCLRGLTLCSQEKEASTGRGFSCQLDSSTFKQTPCLALP